MSRGMGVKNVSNSKCDLQDHSRALAMIGKDRPHTISYQCSVATMSLSCTVSEILSFVPPKFKKGHLTLNTFPSGIMYY